MHVESLDMPRDSRSVLEALSGKLDIKRRSPSILYEAGHGRLLTTTARAVAAEFEKGRFTVKCATGSFNGVWTDMGLKQAYNCDVNNRDFHGIPQKTETMEKHLIIITKLTAISEQAKGIVHMGAIQKRYEDSLDVSKKAK